MGRSPFGATSQTVHFVDLTNDRVRTGSQVHSIVDDRRSRTEDLYRSQHTQRSLKSAISDLVGLRNPTSFKRIETGRSSLSAQDPSSVYSGIKDAFYFSMFRIESTRCSCDAEAHIAIPGSPITHQDFGSYLIRVGSLFQFHGTPLLVREAAGFTLGSRGVELGTVLPGFRMTDMEACAAQVWRGLGSWLSPLFLGSR